MKIFTFSAEGVILEILQVVVSKKTKKFFLERRRVVADY